MSAGPRTTPPGAKYQPNHRSLLASSPTIGGRRCERRGRRREHRRHAGALEDASSRLRCLLLPGGGDGDAAGDRGLRGAGAHANARRDEGCARHLWLSRPRCVTRREISRRLRLGLSSASSQHAGEDTPGDATPRVRKCPPGLSPALKIEMVVAMHCVVARIAPRLARARITPSSVPTARVPTEKGFTGVGGRVAGAARALSWTAAPHQTSSRTALLRARVSHRAHPRAALASPLTRASAEGPRRRRVHLNLRQRLLRQTRARGQRHAPAHHVLQVHRAQRPRRRGRGAPRLRRGTQPPNPRTHLHKRTRHQRADER